MELFKRVISFFLFVLILSVLAGSAHAKQQKVNMKYKGVDRNNDGVVTRDEWRGNCDQSFDNNDWNGDGALSGDEVTPGARRPQGAGASADPFRALDRNNNGVISPSEWTGTMQDFNRLDQDHNGNLSVEEFHQRAGQDQFSELDHNVDGVISREEWHNASKSFETLDLNRDGKLSRDEFYNKQQYPVSVFRELDQNNDKRISRSEWRSTTNAFNRLDANGNNFLSETEFNGSQSNSLVEQIFQEIFSRR
jgi:Ca2+-binding EF-hand superfamily protein